MAKDLLDIKPVRPRRKRLRLGMMHYHLKPGGVVSVMRDTANALRRHSRYESLQIDVIAGVGSDSRAKKTFEPAGTEGDRGEVRIVDVPSLAYRSKPYPDRASFLRAADKLAGDILRWLDLREAGPDCPYVLHAHNISLGKNPVATMAFKRIAEMATDRSLPLWLVNQVHDFAENNRPEQLKAFFTCTGRRDEAFARSFMYPIGSNVVYLTINSADTENLLRIGIPGDRIFLLPDPIDVSQFEQKPLWEQDERELAELGLPRADYKKMMLKRLADCASSSNQVFDDSLSILLSPVKAMRRKNIVESLLLLTLFKHLGRGYQLLITLDANSPPDIAYSRRLKKFAVSRGMPVVIGFGRDIVSGTGRRTIKNGSVKAFSMSDLHALCTAVVTTSIVEGFGLMYHEGWLSRKLVVGRRIAEIVLDFENNGMSFDHLYDRLAVSLADLPGLRDRLLEAYEKKMNKLVGGRSRVDKLTRPAIAAIIEEKVFRSGGDDCVDFADLGVEMQLEQLDRLAGEPALGGRFIDRNPAVGTTFRLLDDGASDLIERNRAGVCSKYSLEAMARRLEHLFELGDSLYRKPCASVSLGPESHAALIERYRTPERIRLLF